MPSIDSESGVLQPYFLVVMVHHSVAIFRVHAAETLAML